jgi:hypothetical protein
MYIHIHFPTKNEAMKIFTNCLFIWRNNINSDFDQLQLVGSIGGGVAWCPIDLS